ncbi:PKD domain-containing protein [Maribacter sp. 2308TA10-17]|uniref:PKD domain-containing protein n=1 Tax=Maribacter sp. 2308TA10-17 TaxID=3386276 RepID=UPI0039BD38C1
MKKFKYIFVILTVILASCDGDDLDIPAAVTPTNLSTSSSVSTDNSGTVTFTATATGANYYHFDFGDGTSALSNTGVVSKTYSMLGDNTYDVVITAGAGEGKTVSETIQVNVSIDFSDPEKVTLLTNDSSKTWYLAASQPGHLGLGPAREGIDGDWWYPKWFVATPFEKCGSEDSDCLCDDELTFSTDGNGGLTYTLDNKGQTYFNVLHQGVAGGSGDTDLCYDFDTSGSKTVSLSQVSGNVPDDQTTGVQMNFSDGGFMGYYVGSSTYEILSISDELLYVRTYDTENGDLAWYHRFSSTPDIDDGGNGSDEVEPTVAAAAPTVPEANVISMFSNAYTDVMVDTWRTDWSDATFEDIMVAGDDVKKYSALGFVGIETVANQIDASSMTHFHTDIWTADATEFKIKLVDFGADGAFDGGDDVEHEITIASPAQGEWVSLDIPLSDFAGLTTKMNIAQLIYVGAPAQANTVYIDNVYFYDSADAPATEPTTAAPAPMLAEADVISMFSNAYTDVTVDTWRTDWSDATFEDIMIAGDDVKKYSALNFVGIETVSSQIDASTMTHFHTDIWTGDATEFRIKLVDFGPDGAFDGGDDVEHEIAITNPNPGEWVSLDIPLTDFTGLTNTANIAQLIYSGDPSGAITVYVDNVYFHK